MKRLLSHLLICGGWAMLLAGCGQKGALYLPDEQRSVAVPATSTSPAATPAATGPAAATPGATPATDNATGTTPPVSAEDSDPQQRRSNTAPRTN